MNLKQPHHQAKAIRAKMVTIKNVRHACTEQNAEHDRPKFVAVDIKAQAGSLPRSYPDLLFFHADSFP